MDLSSEIQNKSEESVAFTGYGNEEDCLELIYWMVGKVERRLLQAIIWNKSHVLRDLFSEKVRNTI